MQEEALDGLLKSRDLVTDLYQWGWGPGQLPLRWLQLLTDCTGSHQTIWKA